MSKEGPGPVGPPLLETKLHAPNQRRDMVRRPRLSSRLAHETLPPLTIVAAPAGFGKTTLLAGWFADTVDGSALLAWLSLDARDNDPAVFWSYLIASVQRSAPHAGEGALSLLRSSHPVEFVVESLLNDLAGLDEEVVLVLDDYHVIESESLHDALAFLVEHLPPQVHLVIGSRAVPLLPLARLRARGDLLEIRAADLRFTADESASYLNDLTGLDLTRDDIDALDARTEGWIAALQLAALSVEGRDDPSGFIANFAGDDRFVVDYLAEEVLERQPDEVRRFLLETSIMDRFTGPLCDAVTGRRGARAMLERLERANLFLVPLDDRRVWFRYHHLFADVLRSRLVDEDPDLVADLHRRASIWHEHNDDRVEAIGHAVAGRHFERAAELIEQAASGVRQRREEGTLHRWLEALPEDVFADRPVLAITLVGARMASGNTTGVEATLELVESTLKRPAPPPVYFDEEQFRALPAQVLVYRAAVALLAGDMHSTIGHADRALDLVEAGDDLLRGSATALLALAHWAAGDLRTAERYYTEAVRALIAADHLPDALGCSLALADVQIAQGRLTDSIRTLDHGLRLVSENPGLRGAADMHVGMSEVLIERNDLDAAADHLEISTGLGVTAGLPQHSYRSRVTAARLSGARGDLDAALDLIGDAEPLFATDFSPPVRPVRAIRARVQLAAGNLASALGWVTEQGLTPLDDLTYVREYEHITLARVLIARHGVEQDVGALEAALRLLNRLLAAAEAGSRAGSVIEILILLAVAHRARNNSAAATAALEEALRRAEPEGYLRLFVHAGAEVTDLLRTATSGVQDTYANKVLAAMWPIETPSQTSPPNRPALIEQLSPRELDVLGLLRSDLSGPGIARELVVSLHTVRTHTKNIYSKLGVNSRREAVTRANELGL